MTKIDFKKELKEFYRPSAKKVIEVNVPTMNFLMVEGMGEPNPELSPEYGQAIEALYTVAYTLKFMIKKSKGGIDYGVLPLEGLWWADDMSDFVNGNKERWKWNMMIMQPDFITDALVKKAIEQVREKKNPVALNRLKFKAYKEGKCAQTLHVGPFSEEGPTVERVHSFIEDSGHKIRGKHHEIYLSDIRRAAPENWKTIIRQPMG